MANDQLVKALRGLALFQGLAPLHVTEIARRADRKVYRPGEKLLVAGDEADAAIVIVDGAAEQLDGFGAAEAPVPLPPGSILAEMAMLVPTTPSCSVVARAQVRALRITRDEMLRFMAEEPAVAEHLIGKISGRLRAVADEMRAIELGLAERLDLAPPPAAAETAVSTVLH